MTALRRHDQEAAAGAAARRDLLLAKVEDKTAASSNGALIGRLLDIPFALRQTLTLDNGSETAGFKELEAATGMSTYFCTPRSPWQRGANENGNGLLRQYPPRGRSFCKVTEGTLCRAAHQPPTKVFRLPDSC